MEPAFWLSQTAVPARRGIFVNRNAESRDKNGISLSIFISKQAYLLDKTVTFYDIINLQLVKYLIRVQDIFRVASY